MFVKGMTCASVADDAEELFLLQWSGSSQVLSPQDALSALRRARVSIATIAAAVWVLTSSF
jgi:hypothetical protein